MKLHHEEWEDSVSSIAHATLKTNHFNKNELLPFTSDIVLMKKYLEDKMCSLTRRLKEEVESNDVWRELNEVTLAHISIFNKRRASEVAELRISSYQQRPDWTQNPNQEFMKTLDDVEQHLLKR